jgi:hypothetical protein
MVNIRLTIQSWAYFRLMVVANAKLFGMFFERQHTSHWVGGEGRQIASCFPGATRADR